MNLIIGDDFTPDFNVKDNKMREQSHLWSKALNDKTILGAVKGSGITVPGKKSLSHQVKQFSLAAYDKVLLFCGTNDYLHSKSNLYEVGKKLSQAIRIIRKHSHCTIYGVLPLPIYQLNGHNLINDRGANGYTFKNLIDMLDLTYSNNGVSALNWLSVRPVINKHNLNKRLKNDHHKNKQAIFNKVNGLIANKVSKFVSERSSSNVLHNLSRVAAINDNNIQISFSNAIANNKKSTKSSVSNSKTNLKSSSSLTSLNKNKSQSNHSDHYIRALHQAHYNVSHASGSYAQMITQKVLNNLMKAQKTALKTKSDKDRKHLQELENGILG